jgi:hypothetical protein
MWTGPPAPYTQPLQPAYLWDNITDTSPSAVVVNDGCSHPVCVPPPGNNAVHLVENRDWYREVASFNGTAGVGTGPLAARPATCSPGAAYWATDQGEWNSLQPGPDGQLYTCTATDTWALYYVPYTYPHPLQIDAVPPAAPSGLTLN